FGDVDAAVGLGVEEAEDVVAGLHARYARVNVEVVVLGADVPAVSGEADVDGLDVRDVRRPVVAVRRGGAVAVEDRAAAGGQDHVAQLRDHRLDAQVPGRLVDIDAARSAGDQDAGLRRAGDAVEQVGLEEVGRRADRPAQGRKSDVHADDV